MQRPTRLFEMPGADIVEIEITKPLPETCFVGLTYRLEGTVKLAGIGVLPWVYAEVNPLLLPLGVAGEVSYERGLPKPISGEFSIDLRFTDIGDYEVTVVATPAPLPLPIVGVEPVVGKSDTMKIKVAEAPPPGAEFEVSGLVIYPAEVAIGETVIIACIVTNIGGEAGSYTVHLGGDLVAEQSVTLEPGESKTISFEVTPDRAKTYSVSVNGLSGSFRAVEVPVADIKVENLFIDKAEVYVGEKVTISVVATNYGMAAGTKRIVCTVS
ncbi:hypothetical protein ES703_83967 [subsurface metagenome]